MRFSKTIIAALAILAPVEMVGASLSVTNFQLVSTQVITSNLSRKTFHADLVNSGPALASVTATASTTDPFSIRVIPDLATLSYAPVPANSQVTSSDTFTILVDPSVPVDFTKLQFTFQTASVALTANAGPNQTVAVGALVTLDGSGSTNPSGGTLSYSWKFTSRPAGSGSILFNSSLVNPLFVVDAGGAYVITLTVSDGVGTSSATVTITTGNSPPVSNAGPNQTVQVGATVTLNGAGSSDVNGDPLTYAWTLTGRPAGSTAALTGANTVSPSFVADLAGTYTVQLIVSDGTVSSGSSTVTITTINSPPVANAGPNQVVNSGALVHLNGSLSTDADGDPLTYHWSLLSAPLGSAAVLSNANIVNPTFTADLSGTYVVQLIVNDGTSNSGIATVTISTSVVQAPTAGAGPNQTVQQHTLVTLHGTATDPQGLPLTFQWSLLSRPSGSTAVLSSTTILTPTFNADLPGTFVAQLIVSNGFVSSPPSTVTITTNSNTAPVANAGPNQAVTVGATVTLDGTNSSDSDNNPLTFAWTFQSVPPGSAAVLTGANAAKPTFVADVAGTYVVQLIVNDGSTSSLPATVTITTQTLALTPNPLTLDGPGAITVTLSSPAGPGGQIVKLSVISPSVATVPSSVTVIEGDTTVAVTVTPMAVGSTTLLATATGFSNAIATVIVTSVGGPPPPPPPTFTISFSPNSVTLTGTETKLLTLNLSAAAPAGGLTINVSSDHTNIATVPPTVSFPVGATSVSVAVTGVSAGGATIHASGAGIADTTASVTVQSVASDILLPGNVSLRIGDTTGFQVTLTHPAPSGGVFISLSSSDSTILNVSPTNIFIPEGTLVPRSPPKITGVAAGSATITAGAFGLTSANALVTVTP